MGHLNFSISLKYLNVKTNKLFKTEPEYEDF